MKAKQMSACKTIKKIVYIAKSGYTKNMACLLKLLFIYRQNNYQFRICKY